MMILCSAAKPSFRKSSALFAILSIISLSILCLRALFFSPATPIAFTGTQTTAKTETPTFTKTDCSQLFLYLPHDISNNGICSQLQNYILALHVAATFQRTLIVWDPQREQANLQMTPDSVFGCSPDWNSAPNHVVVTTGLSQILNIPSSHNHACSRALCQNNHSEWTRLVASSFNDFTVITCDKASVMVSGGRKLRRQYLQRLHQTPQQTNFTQWVSSIGGITPTQLQWFQRHQQQEEDLWNGVAALLVPHVQWQPLLQPVLANQLLQTLPFLPRTYTALHIRRGDKLKREATSMVQQYWDSRGEEYTGSHPNYIPLEAYMAQLHSGVDPSHIYIATDDPVTIRNEIEQFEATHHDSHWIFHLLADHRLHNNGHMNTEPDCHVRYNMTMDAIVDLEVMIRAQVFVGELNSNWGRFIHTMRTEFTGASPVLRDFRVVFGDNQTRYLGQ